MLPGFFHGELAQLARAFAWHAKGHGFDSHILHIRVSVMADTFFIFFRSFVSLLLFSD